MKINPSNSERPDNTSYAVIVIVLTVLALSLGDALIKFTSGEFVIWQVFVLRSLLALPVLLILLKVTAPSVSLVPTAFGWTSLRSLMLVTMWIAYYLSLANLDLSIAAAVFYTLPIFITLFSAAFIGDKIGPLGWAAVFIGFMGVLLILRPSADDFNLYALLPLISAILYALAMVLTRTKCRGEHPLILSIGMNIGFVLFGLAAATFISTLSSETRQGYLLAPWAAMGSSEWLSMALLAIAILIGSIGAAIAYQNGPPSIVGTFDFAYVGFALVWGLVFFSEVPDLLSILGMAMIVVAGVLSLRQ